MASVNADSYPNLFYYNYTAHVMVSSIIQWTCIVIPVYIVMHVQSIFFYLASSPTLVLLSLFLQPVPGAKKSKPVVMKPELVSQAFGNEVRESEKR